MTRRAWSTSTNRCALLMSETLPSLISRRKRREQMRDKNFVDLIRQLRAREACWVQTQRGRVLDLVAALWVARRVPVPDAVQAAIVVQCVHARDFKRARRIGLGAQPL